LVLDFQNVLGNKKNKYLRYSFKEDKYGKAWNSPLHFLIFNAVKIGVWNVKWCNPIS
jgi:hypothetical protein